MPFNERLKNIRKEKKLSRKDLAEKCEIGSRTLQRYEEGEDFPARSFLKKITELGYNLNWLITGEGPKQIDKDGSEQDQGKTTKGIIEEWVQYVREKEGGDGRIVMELSLQVPEFRQWYQEKKSKTPLVEDDLDRKKIA